MLKLEESTQFFNIEGDGERVGEFEDQVRGYKS
jgi:hypothetical protein